MPRIKFFFFLVILSSSLSGVGQPSPDIYPYTIDYFFPEGSYSFDSRIPEPKDILGFEIGQQHADWNDILNYMKALESVSERISIKEFGKTNQFRRFIQVTITSEKNQKKLDNIRAEHLKLTDIQQSPNMNINQMPVVVSLMCSMHGNEPSGVNSSLVLAYYLVALQGEEIEQLLDNTIIVLNPGQNPDGINRFASWVNSTRSFPNTIDSNSREFYEPWPPSRTNHYWADTNRDWLMAQHPEGQNALDMYFEWMPNVVGDIHEQTVAKHYFFSPGHPKRVHPMIPQLNQDLTAKITSYTARSLDKIGTLYFSKERFDDYYLGKGGVYGDIHGSICILFEQLALRGHQRVFEHHGEISFAYAIRNQLHAAIATIKGAFELKNELLEYQRDYYRLEKEYARKDPLKAYIFNARGSDAIAFHFLENMKRHRLDIYHLAKKQIIDGVEYHPEDSYVIPTEQKYYAKVKALMENVTEFTDNVFYDISTWTFPYAYNLQYAELDNTAGLLANKVDEVKFPEKKVIGGKSTVAYIFENKQYYTPKFISKLLEEGLIVKVGTKPFTCPANATQDQTSATPLQFGYGTILVQIQNQPLSENELFALMNRLAVECGINVYALKHGLMDDFDLGSPHFIPLDMPKIAIVTGEGMGVPESGEAWMMLGERFQIPHTLIDHARLASIDLTKYNVLIMSNGFPAVAIPPETIKKIRGWVNGGGTIIATGNAYKWTNDTRLTSIQTIPPIALDTTGYLSYASKGDAYSSNNIQGVILNCRLDYTHPLGWGYQQDQLPMMKTGVSVFQYSDNPYASPLSYLKEPYLSGCISSQNIDRISGSPAVIIEAYGKGRVVVFSDNPNFRMYWYGGTKLFMNAILFGQLL